MNGILNPNNVTRTVGVTRHVRNVLVVNQSFAT